MDPRSHDLIESQFVEFYPALHRYASIALKDEGWAEDVVQDVFHDALRSADVLGTHPNPRGWLMQTLKNKVRKCKHERGQQAAVLYPLDSVPEHVLAVEDERPEGRTEGVMEKIRRRLTKEELHLLKRIVFDKASHTKVSEELNITVWTSQKRLSRVRDKLRELFPER